MENRPADANSGDGETREITAPIDTRSLQEAWARRETHSPEVHLRLTMGAKTDLGRVRENNEDKFDFLEPEDPGILAARGRFYAVADGMGGHAAGQIASELALKTVIKKYYANASDDLETALVAAVKYANALVRDTAAAIPGRSGMGTTLTAAVVHEARLIVAQVGDSRLYLIREGAIRQITDDHSWVAEQVRLGTLDAESAARSPFRNVITRSLGAEPDVKVDVFPVELRLGDRFLICSDGLSGQVEDEQMAEIAGASPPSVACMELIDAANESGGRDNITLLIVRVDAIEPYAPGMRVAVAEREPLSEVEDLLEPVGADARWFSRLIGRR